MATIKRCDRCAGEENVTEQVIAAGVHVDLCVPCFDAVFDGPWFEAIRTSVNVAPVVPRGRRVPGRGERPPVHGFTAAAIEAAQHPSKLASRDEVPTPDGD